MATPKEEIKEEVNNDNDDLIDTILEQKKSDTDINATQNSILERAQQKILQKKLEEEKATANAEDNNYLIVSKYDKEQNKFISLYDEFNLENKESLEKFNNIKPLIDNNKDVYILSKKHFNDFNDFKIKLFDLLPMINENHNKINISPIDLSTFESNLKLEHEKDEEEKNKNNFIADTDSITPPKPSEVQAKFSNVNELLSSLQEEKKYFKPLDAKFTKRDALISGISVFVGLSVGTSLIVGGIVGFGVYKLAKKFFPEKNKDVKLLDDQILLLKEAANSVLAKKMIENNPSLNYEKTLNNLMKNPKNTDVDFNKDIQDKFLDLTQAHNVEFNRKIFTEVRHRFNTNKQPSGNKPN